MRRAKARLYKGKSPFEVKSPQTRLFMSTASGRAPLLGALLLYFLLTLALIVAVPWGTNPEAAPDEGAHADYIKAIANTHALPVFQGQPPPRSGYEFHQPPLYYLLTTPLWMISPAKVQPYAVRGLSLVFGLLTLWVVWNAANLMFGVGSRASAFCTLGAALSPLHQGVGACINNDALAGLWSACLFYLVARAWLEGPTRRLVVLTGVVAGLGALTKLTALPLGAWAFVAVGAALYRRRERPLSSLFPAFVVALLLSSPMLIRNQFLYGDPFAYRLFARAATQVSPGFVAFVAAGISPTTYVRGMVWQMLGTAWGFLGGPNTFARFTGPLNPSGPRFPDPLLLLPFTVVVLVPLWGAWNAWKNRQSAESSPQLHTLSLWWGAGVLLLVLLWVNFAYAHFAGGQARYLHGALVPITLLVAGGLARARAGFFLALLLGAVMLGLSLANVFIWKTLV